MKWFYPGLKIKRWLLLALIGLVLSFLGFALWIGSELVYSSGRAMAPFLDLVSGLPYGVLFLVFGLVLFVLGLQRSSAAVIEALQPGKPLIDALFKKRYLAGGPHLVVIGGGTGLSVLLRELKEYSSNLTAIVTVTDDGGSSGRLRGELGMLPPGDIRSCLLAMADTEPLMEQLFQHRFSAGSGLEGHSFGNLFIAAMTEMYGFKEAVTRFGRVLAIRGRVLPVTLSPVGLRAVDAAGRTYNGQTVLYSSTGPLKRVSLVPPDVDCLPEVIEAINEADAVILGPGSLFTSIIPNLLVPGVVDALRSCRAPVLYICNVATQPGETTGFSAADHVRALLEHSAPRLLDCVIVNSDLSYKPKQAGTGAPEPELVYPDYKRLMELVPRIISKPLINRSSPFHHSGSLLAATIIETIKQRKGFLLGNINRRCG